MPMMPRQDERPDVLLKCPDCGKVSMKRYAREVNYGHGVEYRMYETCFDCGHAGYVGKAAGGNPLGHWSYNKGWGNARAAYWTGDLNDREP